MKFEFRVFQNNQSVPVHTEESDVENPAPKCHELSVKFHLGPPTYSVDYGWRYTDGYVSASPLEQEKDK